MAENPSFPAHIEIVKVKVLAYWQSHRLRSEATREG